MQCQFCVLSCIDFRLQIKNRLFELLRAEYGADAEFDLLTAPGSCHRLVREEEAGKELMLSDLAISVNLHHPEKIVLMQHAECGKYASYMTFDSPEQEREVLIADAKKAMELLQERFPGTQVEVCFAHVRGHGPVEKIERIDCANAV